MVQSKLNVKLLLRVKKHILAKPSRLRMSSWIESVKLKFFDIGVVKGKKFDFSKSIRASYGEPKQQRIPDCGTVACIAGWTCVLSKKMPKERFETPEIAASLLGLGAEGDDLFMPNYWPGDMYEQYKSAKTPRQRATLVAKRIDQIIEEHQNA